VRARAGAASQACSGLSACQSACICGREPHSRTAARAPPSAHASRALPWRRPASTPSAGCVARPPAVWPAARLLARPSSAGGCIGHGGRCFQRRCGVPGACRTIFTGDRAGWGCVRPRLPCPAPDGLLAGGAHVTALPGELNTPSTTHRAHHSSCLHTVGVPGCTHLAVSSCGHEST